MGVLIVTLCMAMYRLWGAVGGGLHLCGRCVFVFFGGEEFCSRVLFLLGGVLFIVVFLFLCV